MTEEADDVLEQSDGGSMGSEVLNSEDTDALTSDGVSSGYDDVEGQADHDDTDIGATIEQSDGGSMGSDGQKSEAQDELGTGAGSSDYDSTVEDE